MPTPIWSAAGKDIIPSEGCLLCGWLLWLGSFWIPYNPICQLLWLFSVLLTSCSPLTVLIVQWPLPFLQQFQCCRFEFRPGTIVSWFSATHKCFDHKQKSTNSTTMDMLKWGKSLWPNHLSVSICHHPLVVCAHKLCMFTFYIWYRRTANIFAWLPLAWRHIACRPKPHAMNKRHSAVTSFPVMHPKSSAVRVTATSLSVGTFL